MKDIYIYICILYSQLHFHIFVIREYNHLCLIDRKFVD